MRVAACLVPPDPLAIPVDRVSLVDQELLGSLEHPESHQSPLVSLPLHPPASLAPKDPLALPDPPEHPETQEKLAHLVRLFSW